jgi:hypothetical protein
MALTVVDIDVLRTYLEGVMGRAKHHAGKVDKIVLALAGVIIWRKDEDKPIKVMTNRGDTANVLWVHIGGTRYALSYNHAEGIIEMRERSLHGQVMHSFSNDTSIARLKKIFEDL